MSYFPTFSGFLIYGDQNIAAAADTRFLTLGFTSQTAPTTPESTLIAPLDGAFRNFTVRHNAAVGNGNDVVYDVQLDNVGQGLNLTLATGAIGEATDNTTIIQVSAGQAIDVSATKPLAIGNGNIDVVFSFLFTRFNQT